MTIGFFLSLLELERQLSRDITCIVELAENAVSSNQRALEACEAHTSQLKHAMAADKESVGVHINVHGICYWSGYAISVEPHIA